MNEDHTCKKHDLPMDYIGLVNSKYKLFCLYCIKDLPHCNAFFPIKEAVSLKLFEMDQAISTFNQKEETRKAQAKDLFSKANSELLSLSSEKQAIEREIGNKLACCIHKVWEFFGEASHEFFYLCNKVATSSCTVLYTQKPKVLTNAREELEKAVKSQDLERMLAAYNQKVEAEPIDIASKNNTANVFNEIKATASKMRMRRDIICKMFAGIEDVLRGSEEIAIIKEQSKRVLEDLNNKSEKLQAFETHLFSVQESIVEIDEKLNEAQEKLEAKFQSLNNAKKNIAALEKALKKTKAKEDKLGASVKILENIEEVKKVVNKINAEMKEEGNDLKCELENAMKEIKQFCETSAESTINAVDTSKEQVKNVITEGNASIVSKLDANDKQVVSIIERIIADLGKTLEFHMTRVVDLITGQKKLVWQGNREKTNIFGK